MAKRKKMNNHNLGAALEKLKSEMYFTYGGLLWERVPGGFMHKGVLARDHHEMDLLIQHEIESLKNSIKP
jgi:hypothetical protein